MNNTKEEKDQEERKALKSFHKMMIKRFEKSDKEYLNFHLAKLKELEIEPMEPIEIETIEPIKIESPEPIKVETPKVRINRYGKAVLKSKVIPKTKSDKLPDQIKDYEGWKKKRGLRFGASDFATFTTYQEEIPNYVFRKINNLEKEFKDDQIEAMELGHFIESRTHEKLAKMILDNGKATLGSFEFSEVYLSKNRQYYNFEEERLGAQVDGWGIINNEKTIIEIKSTSAEGFYKIQRALELRELGDNANVQDIFHDIAPYYYYQVQAQLFCTNSKQAVIHIVNRNRYETLTFFIERDEKAIEWCLGVVDRFFETKDFYVDSSLERIEEKFLENALGFDLNYPAPKELEKLNQAQMDQVLSLVRENIKIEETLVELLEVEKKGKSLSAKLTRLGFKDNERKLYKKSLTRVAG